MTTTMKIVEKNTRVQISKNTEKIADIIPIRMTKGKRKKKTLQNQWNAIKKMEKEK